MIDRSSPGWEELFNKANKRVEYALKDQNSHVIISVLMERLYVLRNQLIHGGATWNGTKNRDQVLMGNNISRDFIPLLVENTAKEPHYKLG